MESEKILKNIFFYFMKLTAHFTNDAEIIINPCAVGVISTQFLFCEFYVVLLFC